MPANRGCGCPIFGIILALSSRTCFVPKCVPFFLEISIRKGPFWETDELPTISIKFRKIADNPPPFGEALFSNPNHGWGCPIFVIILAIASLARFVQTFGEFLFEIIYRKVSISATDEFPGPLKLRSIVAAYRCMAGSYFEP